MAGVRLRSRRSRSDSAAEFGVQDRGWPVDGTLSDITVSELARWPFPRRRAALPAPKPEWPVGLGGLCPLLHEVSRSHFERNVLGRLGSAPHREYIRRLSLWREDFRQRALQIRQQF